MKATRIVTLGLVAVAFATAVFAVVGVLSAPAAYSGIATTTSSAGDAASSRTSATFLEVNGFGGVLALALPCLLAALPLLALSARGSTLRMLTWTAAVVLLGFSILAGFSIGLLFMPSALVLVCAGAASLLVRDEEPAVGQPGAARGMLLLVLLAPAPLTGQADDPEARAAVAALEAVASEMSHPIGRDARVWVDGVHAPGATEATPPTPALLAALAAAFPRVATAPTDPMTLFECGVITTMCGARCDTWMEEWTVGLARTPDGAFEVTLVRFDTIT